MIIPCWHPYHKMACPVGFVDIEERWQQILETKPVAEHAVRLRLLKPVAGVLPMAFIEAGEARHKAQQLYVKTGTEATLFDFDRAWRAYEEACQTYMPEVIMLHALECGCAWTLENNNILEFHGTS